jgi:hypothetical protein
MSYIVRAGNLAGPVDIKADDAGHLTGHVTVIVNDTALERETGQWKDLATTAYRLTARGRTAQRLHSFQERNGNKRIVFAGTYRVRTYRAADGTTRLSHDVWVDHVGADLSVQNLQVLDSRNEAVSGIEARHAEQDTDEAYPEPAPAGNPWTGTGAEAEPGYFTENPY